MRTYGNSNGRNKGKKYKKREASTPESEQRAADFLIWYGDNCEAIRAQHMARHNYDDEVATETFLNIYDAIMFKGLIIKSNTFYYGVSYNSTMLAKFKRVTNEARNISLDTVKGHGLINVAENFAWRDTNDDYHSKTLGEVLVASDYDYQQYEIDNAAFVAAAWAYLRGKYSEQDCAIFEMYTEGQPKITFIDIARATELHDSKIGRTVGKMRNDLVYNFAPKMNVCDFYYSNLSL